MKIKAFGVSNWDDEASFFKQLPTFEEWSSRLYHYVPDIHDRVCITPGSYSPITEKISKELDRLKIDVIQIPFFRHTTYSKQNNFFRLGFMTGIWNALLLDKNHDSYELDFDILLHCQCRTFIGEDMSDHVEEFQRRPDLLMAPGFNCEGGSSIDVGLMFMKTKAALAYAATGYRHSCEQTSVCLNCEDEAFLLFYNTWYNPWPNLVSTKQKDSGSPGSRFTYTDIEDFKTWPIIATGDKHIDQEYYDEWINNHKITV